MKIFQVKPMGELSASIRKLKNQIRELLALKLLNMACDVAPENKREAFSLGMTQIVLTAYSNPDPSESYTSLRFKAICKELNLDVIKVLHEPSGIIKALYRSYKKKEIDEVQVMRSLRNLDIFNNGMWRIE